MNFSTEPFLTLQPQKTCRKKHTPALGLNFTMLTKDFIFKEADGVSIVATAFWKPAETDTRSPYGIGRQQKPKPAAGQAHG